jgi:hypothetical protein
MWEREGVIVRGHACLTATSFRSGIRKKHHVHGHRKQHVPRQVTPSQQRAAQDCESYDDTDSDHDQDKTFNPGSDYETADADVRRIKTRTRVKLPCGGVPVLIS